MLKRRSEELAKDAQISQELWDEAREIKQNYLFDDSVSKEIANPVIQDFNRRWIEAGGSEGMTIINKK